MIEPENALGTTPLSDDEGLIPQSVKTMGELNALETENILKATRKYHKKASSLSGLWFTTEFLQKVHKEMLSDVWDWAGEIRKRALTIGVEPAMIRENVGKLCGDVSYWDADEENAIGILERSARIHHNLTFIHMFRNGNGRHARLIQDVYLRSHGEKAIPWPVAEMTNIRSEIRKEYVAAVKVGDQGDFRPLVRFLEKLKVDKTR